MIEFKLTLLKTKPLRNGEYPIYLRLTKDRIARYVSTKESCKIEEWDDDKSKVKANNRNHKQINASIGGVYTKIKNYYDNSLTKDEQDTITTQQLIKAVTIKNTNKNARTNFFEIIENKENELIEAGKIGTAKWLHDTRNSMLKFHHSHKLDLRDINVEWLKKYELFLKKNNCVDSGIAVRMRAIRSVYNKAIKDANIKISYEFYPFKDYQISKLKGEKKIRAISVEEINLIKNLDTAEYPHLQLTKDLFLFSYYTGGMNYIDMAKLIWNNIYRHNDEERIEYVRSKTKGKFNFVLIEPAKEILEYYKIRKTNTNYIFPILLHENLTPKQIAYRKHKTLTKFNKDLKEIGLICNIDFDLTSYVARHSFASNLKYKNISTDVISEALGHQNIKVTQTYLKRFENVVIDDALKTLV
jgi:site-specific recombinase XerD